MLIIWGSRKSFKPIGGIDAGCPNCGTQMGLFWAVKKFTLYWVPLFPMEKNYAMGCHHCKTFFALNQSAGAHMHSQILSGAIGNANVSSAVGIPPPNQRLYNAAPSPNYLPPSGYPTVAPPLPQIPALPQIPEMPPLICGQCGRPVEKGALICGACGTKAP